MSEGTQRLVTTHEPAAEWDLAWSEALSTLELTVTRAEALLARDAVDSTPATAPSIRPDWVAPTGALPERLQARAEGIAVSQLRLAEDLSRALAAARHELRLVERIQAHALDRSTPAFLDAGFSGLKRPTSPRLRPDVGTVGG